MEFFAPKALPTTPSHKIMIKSIIFFIYLVNDISKTPNIKIYKTAKAFSIKL